MDEEKKYVNFTGFIRVYKLFRKNKLEHASMLCTKLLQKNPLDQATWALKMQCISDGTYVDELDNEDVGIAETFLEQNVIAPNARPGTSFQRPKTTAKGINPILRPTTNAGRPVSGVVRPMSSLKTGSMDQAVRTARTAKTARAVSSTSARNMRLGTSSMASTNEIQIVNLARLNIDKYGSDPLVNRQLFEYVFYFMGDIKAAHQIAGCATKAAGFDDWYWKNQLAKCYFRLGMIGDAEKQLLSSLKLQSLVETYALLGKVYNRLDQPMSAMRYYKEGIEVYPNDVTLLLGMARNEELLGEYQNSVDIYKKILSVQANNIEAIACLATTYYYSGKPEIALRYFRRIMQMGANSAELNMNIALCCMASQQYDLAIQSALRAQSTMTEDVAADIWYNIGQIMVDVGDLVYATRAYRIALSHDPDHSESLVNLAILKHREGRFDEARSLYMSALSKNPGMFEGNFNLALVYYQQGKYNESRQLLKQALIAFPEHDHCKKLMKTINGMFESSIEIFVELCIEYKFKEINGREIVEEADEVLGITMENVESSEKSKTFQMQQKNVRTLRNRRILNIRSDENFDFAEYPKDSHSVQLKFTSNLKNSSELALNPHFAKIPIEKMSNDEWEFEILKSYVQWVVQKNESFEQAVFEMKISRKIPKMVSIITTLMYLTNILLIFEIFPVFSLDFNIKTDWINLLCVQVLITLISAPQALGKFHRYLLSQLLLSTLICLSKNVLPFFLFHLRCCPIESDPSPPLFPSPSDQFSLDTERAKCHAAMDSARAESLRSPRAANFDMCMNGDENYGEMLIEDLKSVFL
ncbi:unnamed protein product [Caenorhabditis angaria]|uniref:Uncharacterized protein n=1 Tax=Caenorhabditis angaria TaxID=860376 RepID=A0A9P1IX83_9PELO|nr:unnamed protein product [Caenorhabditis angaria]